MEMTIICSEKIKQIVMMFNLETLSMTDQQILEEFPNFVRTSDAYDNFKMQNDLTVNRTKLPVNESDAKRIGGDFLYSYLVRGYVCLGNFIGKPTPDMSHQGILTVQRIRRVGFRI
ncbi:hypothetical protein OAI_21595 [Vibrio cyclitrophicus FF160]|uniref:hypothetical protein n=1 Tax=Vibrio cyclitrophicus TaxID=47951 RepID=UPI0002E66D9F|nr:hypothetical protein [Vibrio cyclitrophicus]OEE84139.1 hypothetical protein OAI_21595 [Vibrio cyclitrophicus FF160]PMJ23242.1 hypothetical protein BCU28_01770 [Vibrio cyclitrophicus]